MNQTTIIEGWLRLYNRLNSCAYAVIEWPDENERNRQAIDALCEDPLGNRLAIEHTLIQPFTGAKEDDARFLRTLADLEDNPELIVAGFTIHVSQPVAAVPKGIQRSILRQDILHQLREALPALPRWAPPRYLPGHADNIRVFFRETVIFAPVECLPQGA